MSNKRKRPSTSQTEPKRLFIFIGRICCPPFIFLTNGSISQVNREWLKTGDIDELDYEAEARYQMIDLNQTDTEQHGRPTKRTRSSHFRPPCLPKKGNAGADTWSQGQLRALWLGQLLLGEGKDWSKVRRMVNKEDPGHPRKVDECQHKWVEIKHQAFGEDVIV